MGILDTKKVFLSCNRCPSKEELKLNQLGRESDYDNAYWDIPQSKYFDIVWKGISISKVTCKACNSSGVNF